MTDGFSEAVEYDWQTVSMCPAPAGTVSYVFDGDDEIVVPCPMFLLQEARAVITVLADENGVGDREFEPLDPPFMTRVVAGIACNWNCGHTEIEPAFGEVSVDGVRFMAGGHHG